MEPLYQHIFSLAFKSAEGWIVICNRYEQTDNHFISFVFRQPTCRVIIIKTQPEKIICCHYQSTQ